MAPAKPKAGDRFVATSGPLEGTTVTVVEVVPATVAGAAAFVVGTPLHELHLARQAEALELAELRAAARGLDGEEAEAAQRKVAELADAHGRAAHEREAPWQDTAVLVEWEEPAMVADTEAEPRLVEVPGTVRPGGGPATRAVWPMVPGTVLRRWSASLSTFRQDFEEA